MEGPIQSGPEKALNHRSTSLSLLFTGKSGRVAVVGDSAWVLADVEKGL